jgi:ABC-type nitrate/sulfonate/bicarbonate transport system substrate-binding protein
MKLRDVGVAAIVFLIVALSLNSGIAFANPYLAKPGEPTVRVRIGACAVTGGFIHLYSALDNRLFEKYGINAETIVVRGGGVALAALASDEINFLYCSADANIARIGTGADGKLLASPLIGLPYVVLARKDIKRAADLKGKSIGVTRPGDFPYRLAKEFLKKHNLSEKDVTLATVGGTPTERYTLLLQDVFQATLIQPPLELARQDGMVIRKKAGEIYDNVFVENLEKSGFMTELWGGAVPGDGKKP